MTLHSPSMAGPALVAHGPGITSVIARRRATVMRVLRCFAVSVGTTLLSAAVLATLVVGAGVPAGPANVVAVVSGIAPVVIAVTFAALWVVQFVLLDRVVFTERSTR